MAPIDERQNLPLTEAAFYILLCLASGPKHGYAILKGVETLSEGRILLSTGTLYGGLKRFLKWDWIRRVNGKEADGSGRPRKGYALTEKGRLILNAEIARLKNLVKTARIHNPQGA